MLVRRGSEVTSWPLESGGRPDLAVADELARWQLMARRHGCSIQVRDAWEELLRLLDLIGLTAILLEPSE